MKGSMFTGAAALALLAAPVFAQEAATGDQQMLDTAMQSAQGVGMQDVANVEGAFVLQGISATGTPVLMVVGPAGELLGIAAPMLAATAQPTAAETGAEPEAGEPAQEGFMATQTQPASPEMWDPAAVERAMQGLELGMGGVAGEVPEQ